MREYTFSRARQQLAGLLDQARRDGGVLIRRRDGQQFEVRPSTPTGGSPLDVPGVALSLPAGALLDVLGESRSIGAPFVRERPTHRKSK